jgi:predicted RNA-binding Zn ribbon-like protein
MPEMAELRFVSGAPSLDFVNSLDWRTSDEPVEYLRSFGDLLEWSVLTGILTASQSRTLARVGTSSARAAALRRAVAFREAAYRTLRAVGADGVPEPSDARLINETIAKARAKLTLHYEKGGFSWKLNGCERQLDLSLWKIAISFGDLVTSEDLTAVRECGGSGCGWLFLDSTRNHSRRWCSMDGCGNRAKARRFYNRYYR